MPNKLVRSICVLLCCLGLTAIATGHGLGHGANAQSGNTSGQPLGDQKISTSAQRGYVMACQTRLTPSGAAGAHRAGPWIRDGRWYASEKPTVEGSVQWPNAQISITVESDQRVVRSNQLPTHTTGEFPIRTGTTAYQYDRNPNAITAQQVLLRLPAQPKVSAQPTCVPMGMIGFALSGVAIFNAFDLAGRDAPAYEIQDKCNGHPEIGGAYHYHDWSDCMQDTAGARGEHSDLVGYMLDGFAIFGPKGMGAKDVTNADLDECHGHTHEVMIDGKKVTTYHYHFTKEFPYTIGCFRGSVDPQLLQRNAPNPPPRRPPPH